MKRIFIDAGHGGVDPGAVGNGMREADINFEVAKMLAQNLKKLGFETKLSRPTKTHIPTHPRDGGQTINARALMSNDWGADYFISIHTNAAGGTGAESFFWGADARKFSQSILDTYCKEMALRNRRNEQTDRWGVIRLTHCPAILFELAFIDAPASKPDIGILRHKRGEMANALTKGICKYFGIDYLVTAQAMSKDVQAAISSLNRHGVISATQVKHWRNNYHRLRYVDSLIINIAASLGGK